MQDACLLPCPPSVLPRPPLGPGSPHSGSSWACAGRWSPVDIDDHSGAGNRIQAEVNFRSVSHVSSFVSQAESQMKADVRPRGAEEVGVAGPCAEHHSYPAAQGRAWAVLCRVLLTEGK